MIKRFNKIHFLIFQNNVELKNLKQTNAIEDLVEDCEHISHNTII